MIASVKERGVITPIIVRALDGGAYQILSGHNRVNAAKEARLTEIAAVVHANLSDDEAEFIVTETNLMQRSFADLKHSERAFVLKNHLQALQKPENSQGKRSDLVALLDEDQLLSHRDTKVDSTKRAGEQYALYICAYLAPDAIGLNVFLRVAEQLGTYAESGVRTSGRFPDELRRDLLHDLKREQLLRDVTRYSLMKRELTSLSMHRLLQEVIRDGLESDATYIRAALFSIFFLSHSDIDDDEEDLEDIDVASFCLDARDEDLCEADNCYADHVVSFGRSPKGFCCPNAFMPELTWLGVISFPTAIAPSVWLAPSKLAGLPTAR